MTRKGMMLLVALAFVVSPHGVTSTQRIYKPTFEEEVQSARLSCEARVVEKPDLIRIPLREWSPWMPDSVARDRTWTMQPFVLEIDRVYVGNASAGDRLDVFAGFPYAREMLHVRDRGLFLLNWNPSFRGGCYYVADPDGINLRVGGNYKRIDGSLIPIEKAQEAAKEVSLPGLAGRAELVVVGRTAGRHQEQLEISSRRLKAEILEVVIEKVLKGTADERIEVVLFDTGRQGQYFPEFRMSKPRNVGTGTRWMMFLVEGSHGWYPQKGHHGMLLIDETGELLRNGMPVGVKLQDAEQAIAGGVPR